MPCGVPDSDDMDVYHLEETIKKPNRKLFAINEVYEKTIKFDFSVSIPVHVIFWIEAYKKEDAAKEA